MQYRPVFYFSLSFPSVSTGGLKDNSSTVLLLFFLCILIHVWGGANENKSYNILKADHISPNETMKLKKPSLKNCIKKKEKEKKNK